MRKRFAIRMRKKIIALGGIVESEGWLREPGGKRKECGYSVTIDYKGWHIDSLGFDELRAYQLAAEVMADGLPELEQMEVS